MTPCPDRDTLLDYECGELADVSMDRIHQPRVLAEDFVDSFVFGEIRFGDFQCRRGLKIKLRLVIGSRSHGASFRVRRIRQLPLTLSMHAKGQALHHNLKQTLLF